LQPRSGKRLLNAIKAECARWSRKDFVPHGGWNNYFLEELGEEIEPVNP
jgi:hypothetical protein